MKIGLALSGFGVGGAAAVGVIEALEERGLAPDAFAGSGAAGAAVLLYAATRSADETLRLVTTLLAAAPYPRALYRVCRDIRARLGIVLLSELSAPAAVLLPLPGRNTALLASRPLEYADGYAAIPSPSLRASLPALLDAHGAPLPPPAVPLYRIGCDRVLSVVIGTGEADRRMAFENERLSSLSLCLPVGEKQAKRAARKARELIAREADGILSRLRPSNPKHVLT